MTHATTDAEIVQEMKAYVGFTEHDAALLRVLWPIVEPEVPWICARFYARILATPAAREVLRHESQVASLKVTLAGWLRELLCGPHDEAYFERRRRIGTRHVEVALPSRFMFTAMSGFCQDLDELCERLPPGEALATRRAVRRISDLDLAVMTGTFVQARESRQLATLQELIVAHLPVAIVLFDRDGRVTAATRHALRLLPERDVLGVPWREALPEALQRAADLEALVRDALKGDAPRVLPRVDADLGAGPRSLRITAVPLDRPDARVLLHVEDLSDAVGLEARLQQSEALARLGSLSAAVAHELRNPLAGMSAAIQVLLPSFDDSDRRKAILGKFQDQVRRLDVLVSDLLSFARPGVAHLRSVDLAALAEGVADLVHHDATVEVSGAGRAHADPNLVHQILLNLTQNAIHATEGRGRVHLVVSEAQVAVEDDGPGVPAAIADEIFKPFFTTRTRGTGLGLAICARSAASMDATLRLEPPGGLKGARFVLRLPADLAPAT